MLTADRIEIVSTDNVPELERVNAQLTALIVSHEGAIPGSRGFGLPAEFLDLGPEESLNAFAIELQEKAAEYVPGVSIEGVEGDVSLMGTGDIKISIAKEDTEDGTD